MASRHQKYPELGYFWPHGALAWWRSRSTPPNTSGYARFCVNYGTFMTTPVPVSAFVAAGAPGASSTAPSRARRFEVGAQLAVGGLGQLRDLSHQLTAPAHPGHRRRGGEQMLPTQTLWS
jgi:hypothetical protein